MKMSCEINFSFLKLELGLPEDTFFQDAWASEPLTAKLNGTNIPFALPPAEPNLSIVAKYHDTSIGQCSANQTITYWNHINKIDCTYENESTQTFVKIHQKAVADEKKHLNAIKESDSESLHSAGIAILPEFRGNNLGFFMRKEQIQLCKDRKATTLFCETTNSFSASTVKKANFFLVAEYPYKDLAIELAKPELESIDDSFSVWCLKL